MSDNIEVYRDFCNPRFGEIERNQEQMQRDISDIKIKLFNGMSSSIAEIKDDMKEMRATQEKRKRSRSLWVRDIILTLLGSGGIISLIITYIIGGR